MNKLISFLSALFLCASCQSNSEDLNIETAVPLDSFTVYGLDAEAALYAIIDSSNTEIVTFHRAKRQLEFYKKDSTGDFHFEKSIPVPFRFGDHLVAQSGSIFAFTQDKNYVEFDTTDRSIKVFAANDLKPMLKENFKFLTGKSGPIYKKNDSIVLRYSHNHPNFIPESEEDSAVSIYRMAKDSLVLLRNKVQKHHAIKETMIKDPYFCFMLDTMHLIYPNIDSIFSYSIATDYYKATPIQNPFFKKPEVYDFEKRFQQKYVSEYFRNNFSYDFFGHSATSGHYFTIFRAPYLENTNSPFLKDYALILDSKFNAIKCYDLGKHMMNAERIIKINGGGVAVPYSIPGDDTKLKYLVFDF